MRTRSDAADPLTVLRAELAAARAEYEAAEALFREARDPDLIDQAIYRLAAAERRIVFVLHRARAEGAAS
jgi:hypothetical protein